MPSLPAPLAASAERFFGRSATVAAVEDLSPGLRKATFAVPTLARRPWTMGQEIEIRASARDMRHYTIAGVDPSTGDIDVVFALHADGPGTAWARALSVGDGFELLGPVGSVRRRAGRRELFLGDASTLGLFAALLPTAGSAYGAVEVPAADVDAATAFVPGLDVLTAQDQPGAALREWLHEHHPAVAPTGSAAAAPTRACLAGHGQTIQALRSRLRLLGVPRSTCATKPHWATGRRGL